MHCLEQHAAAAAAVGLLATLAARSGLGRNHGADGLLKHLLETGLVERRALQVLDAANVLGHVRALLVRDGRKLLLGQALQRIGVVAEIQLGADQQVGSRRAVVLDLGVPLGLDVLERGRRNNGEADQENVRLWVRERAKTIIVLLTSGIPKTKVNRLSVNHHVGRVVIKHGGDVLARESVGLEIKSERIRKKRRAEKKKSLLNRTV